jgi:hypothetical protein
MKNLRFIVPSIAALLASTAALGEVSTADDRIAVSANGSTLTGTNGGGGASVAWLHNFDTATLVSAAAEHQALSVARWTFGSLNGSLTRGPDDQRYTIYGEVHEGAGDNGPHAFGYHIEAAGVVGTFLHRLSAQLEDKQIDVLSTHGNLPKFGLSYLWGPHLQTALAYQHSVKGNLGTRLWTARIDEYGATVNFLAGAALGQVTANVAGYLNIPTRPGTQLHEGYVGVSRPFAHSRSELTFIADYQDLSGSKRATVTLNYIFHVGATGSTR